MENILLYMVISLIILMIILIIYVYKLSKIIKKLSYGKDGKSLEEIIYENNKLSKKIVKEQKIESNDINKLKSDISNTIQNISVIRFDALKNSGGLQSFSIGLTDNNKNGVVISSMYTRDHTNIFAKEIINGKSKHTLTEEEKMAINN